MSAISGQRWKAFRDADKSIQEAFRAWFSGFRLEYRVDRAFILSLGKVGDVQSQQSVSPSETVDSHDRDELTSA